MTIALWGLLTSDCHCPVILYHTIFYYVYVAYHTDEGIRYRKSLGLLKIKFNASVGIDRKEIQVEE